MSDGRYDWRGVFLLWLAIAAGGCRATAPAAQQQPENDKPALALLSALPIVFGEGFGINSPAHPVLSALAQDYRLRPVDGPDELAEGGILLAAQPRALTAERLVALDGWVRRGGRVLLLADPHLAWPSDRAIGDKFRPPLSFDDTGLLTHWGLRLSFTEAPRQLRSLGGRTLSGTSPGRLTASDKSCVVSDDGLRADCRIGRGRAVVIADADWLDPQQWLEADDGPEQLGALTDQLALLAR